MLRWWFSYPEIGDLLDRLAARSRGRRHNCILWEHSNAIPPYSELLKDLTSYHDGESVRTAFDPASISDAYLAHEIRNLTENMSVKEGILQHYGLPTFMLDVTFDLKVALWFALHKPDAVAKNVIRYTESSDPGCIYVFWVPVSCLLPTQTNEWVAMQLEESFWPETRRLLFQPGQLQDLSFPTLFLPSHMGLRLNAQSAGMLTGRSTNHNWPDNAYASYVVARIIVEPGLIQDPRLALRGIKTSDLFPLPKDDRPLYWMQRENISGLVTYTS